MTVFEQTQGEGQNTHDKLQFITIQPTGISYKKFNGFFFAKATACVSKTDQIVEENYYCPVFQFT